MRDRIYPDVAGACLDVLAYFCGDVGWTAECSVTFCGVHHIRRVTLAQEFARDCMRRFDTFAERTEYLHACAKGLESAARVLRFLADEIQAVGEALGRDDVRHPAVAEARGALEWTFSAAANPDGRSAGSSGPGLHADFAEAEVFAAMLDAIVAPEPLHHLDCFGRAPAAFADRYAAGLILAREFTADPNSENEMPRAQQTFQRRDHFGDGNGMPQRQQVNAGAESEFG